MDISVASQGTSEPLAQRDSTLTSRFQASTLRTGDQPTERCVQDRIRSAAPLRGAMGKREPEARIPRGHALPRSPTLPVLSVCAGQPETGGEESWSSGF